MTPGSGRAGGARPSRGSGWTHQQRRRFGGGLWPGLAQRNPAQAVEFVSWAKVLDVIARGCGGGRRQAYEAAYAIFGGWAELMQWIPGETEEQRREREATIDPTLYARAHDQDS
jgi:hypothetical protein